MRKIGLGAVAAAARTLYKCRRYRVTGSATSETVRLDGFYKAGALDVSKATDPDGCTLLTFTDWRGIKILERRVLTDNTFADTYFLYDVRGNLRVILPPEASSLMTSNGSSWSGSNPTYSKYVYIYRYDRRGNCIYSKVAGGGAIERTSVEYNYNSLGQIASKYFDIRTTVEYSYNLRGQLTSISAGDLFSQTLKYETGATPCYNGNISEMSVCYSGSSPITRKYTYDRMNRLTAMTSSDGFNTAYTYNLNSSPLTIKRYGPTSDGTVGLIDDLMMTYSGNQLTRVIDSADPVILENSIDFDKSSRSYTYDLDGRLYSDGNIEQSKYTPNGNPLAFKCYHDYKLATYRYTATGMKLSATVYDTPTYTPKPMTRYYVGTMEFMQSPSDKAPQFERVTMPWGYIDAAGDVHYYIQDYQGNVRMVADAAGNVEQATDYYPYGMPMATSTGAAVNRYKYSGKELETRNVLNFYDFAARLQFPAVNLMNQPDINARDYPRLNPYLYCAANPINITDPTGQTITVVTQGGLFQWKEVNGAWGLYDSNDNIYSGDDNAVKSLISSLTTLMDKPAGKGLVTAIAKDEREASINPYYKQSVTDKNMVGWRPNGIRADGEKENVPTTAGADCNPTVNLAHELAHVLFNWTIDSKKIWCTVEQFYYEYDFKISHDINISDIFTTHIENQIRAEHGLPMRTHYIISTSGRGIGPELIGFSKSGIYSKYYDSNSQTKYKPLKSKVTPYYYLTK